MAGETKPRKRPGRRRIEINWQAFDGLCKLQCTLNEIAGFFDCSPDTIERAVQREHRMRFADYFAQRSMGGKVSLRRKQFQVAVENGNPTMLIWLGKQWLGQRDKFDHELTGAGGGPIAAVVAPMSEAEAAELYRAKLQHP